MPFLDRENTVAPPGYNRWLVPPAALAIHLAIGQVYAFSVFKLPLTKIVRRHQVAATVWRLERRRSSPVIFSIAIAFLGMSAAVFGKWVERSGPRKTMIASGPYASAGGSPSARLGSTCTSSG